MQAVEVVDWYLNQGCEVLCWSLNQLIGYDWKRGVAEIVYPLRHAKQVYRPRIVRLQLQTVRVTIEISQKSCASERQLRLLWSLRAQPARCKTFVHYAVALHAVW